MKSPSSVLAVNPFESIIIHNCEIWFCSNLMFLDDNLTTPIWIHRWLWNDIDADMISARLQGQSQLSNPSNLPWLYRIINELLHFFLNGINHSNATYQCLVYTWLATHLLMKHSSHIYIFCGNDEWLYQWQLVQTSCSYRATYITMAR